MALQAQESNQECLDFLNEIPAYFVKGYVSVPENWSLPEGRKIKVFYYGQLPDKNSKQKPLLFFNGGPTMSSHNSFGRFQTEGRWPEVAFMYIDQRGTGCSDPYPSAPTKETIERLTNYGSRSIVLDAEAVREKLFGKKSQWQIFGQSYGGLIAHRYLALAPQSLSAIHIHGHSVMSSFKEFYKLRLLSQKRIAETYFKKYPDDFEKLSLIRKQILPSTCFSNDRVRICGPEIIDGLAFVLGMPSLWTDALHGWISNLLDKDGLLISSRLKRFANSFVFSAFAPSAISAAIIAKLEMMDSGSEDQCTDALKQLREEGEHPETWPLNECRLTQKVEFISHEDDELGKLISEMKKTDPLHLADIKLGFEKNNKIQMHLYSSELDAYVPKESYQEEVRLLGTQIHYQNFELTGHDGYYLESTIIDNILSVTK